MLEQYPSLCWTRYPLNNTKKKEKNNDISKQEESRITDGPQAIFPFLYLGCREHSMNKEKLKKSGITHVLNLTTECENSFPGLTLDSKYNVELSQGDFAYHQCRINDDFSSDISRYFEECFEFIGSC
jgi:dual specificity MAP kinase phosphatase